MQLPEGYQTVMPYLLLEDTNGFLDFTMKVFNATDKGSHKGEDGKIVHGEILIGDPALCLVLQAIVLKHKRQAYLCTLRMPMNLIR